MSSSYCSSLIFFGSSKFILQNRFFFMNEKCLMINGMRNLFWFVLCSRAIPFLLTLYDRSLFKTLFQIWGAYIWRGLFLEFYGIYLDWIFCSSYKCWYLVQTRILQKVAEWHPSGSHVQPIWLVNVGFILYLLRVWRKNTTHKRKWLRH